MSRTFNMVVGGGGKAVLAVAVTNGTATNVTATKSGVSVSLTYSGGIWSAELPSFGAWTVTITDGTHSNSATVNASVAGLYTVSIYMPDVPIGYTQLEYIQSSSGEYINPGVECTSDLVVDMTVLWFEATNFAIAGGINVSGPPYFRHHFTPLAPYSPSIYWCQYNGSNYGSIEGDLAANEIHTVHVDPVNGIAILDGDTKSFTPLPSGLTTGYSYGVMARIASNGSTQGKASRCYYFACSVGGQTLRKMYPARRNSDSVLGMYDTATNTFKTNAGTGTFIAGPAV